MVIMTKAQKFIIILFLSVKQEKILWSENYLAHRFHYFNEHPQQR